MKYIKIIYIPIFIISLVILMLSYYFDKAKLANNVVLFIVLISSSFLGSFYSQLKMKEERKLFLMKQMLPLLILSLAAIIIRYFADYLFVSCILAFILGLYTLLKLIKV